MVSTMFYAHPLQKTITYVFFFLPFVSQMNAFFPMLFFITILSWTRCENNEVLIKPTGTLYFFDNEHIIKFEENLDVYYERANTLDSDSIILDNLCKQSPNLPNCNFLTKNLKEIATKAQKEKRHLQLKRHKRELLCFLLTSIVIAISSAIAGVYMGLEIASQNQKELATQQNLQTNTTMQHFEYEVEGLMVLNESFTVEFEDDRAFRTNITEIEFMNNLVNNFMINAELQNQDTIKFINVLGGDLREKFFSIIDVNTFNETVHSTGLGSPLSFLHPGDVLKLSTVDSEFVNDTITIFIHIPILIKNKYFLDSLIPIPITRDNTNFILNMDSKHIIENNNSIAELPLHTLTQCAQTIDLVVCYTSSQDEMLPVDACVESIILNRSTTASCTYRGLPYKTHLIKISDKSIYAHIIEPILLKISCGHSSKILNITQNGEIFHEQNCKIFKQNKNAIHEENVTIVKIESEFIQPNYEIFENKTWSNKQIFANQRNNKMNNWIEKLRRLQTHYNHRAKIIEIADSGPFSFITDFLQDLSENIRNILLIIIFIIITIILLIILICSTCRK